MQLSKTLATLFIITSVISSLTACGGADEPTVSEETSTIETSAEASTTTTKDEIAPEPEPEVVRDLGGLHVTIATWVDVLEPEVKASAQEEALWEFRHEMMEKHNFTIEEKALGKWNTTLELMSTSMIAGDPAAEVFHVSASFVNTVINNNLAYDLSTLDELDLNHWKWDPAVTDFLTRDGATYGVYPNQTPNSFVFFNKRLFEEAGLDPDLPYDLQASGDWTWEAFEEIAAKLSRDTDNDGINDVYALVFDGKLFDYAIISNGTQIVTLNEDGKFVNTLNTPEAMAALTWVTDLYKHDYDTPVTHWDGGYEQMFMTGQIAMMPHDKEKLLMIKDMEDDFGMVIFPKGPAAENYAVTGTGAGWFIPNTFTPEEAADIAFALDIWATEPPGYDSEDDWMMEDYKLFRDDRAVEETMVKAKEPGIMRLNNRQQISGISTNSITQPLMHQGATPAEAVEGVMGIFDAAIAKANGETTVAE
ncbi:MAG: hypothetical protein ATN31_06045 [Candidatus Epulonipiscioides saccharophilum]|nr:MAG: hypothetical protein ATN31_06045 [Epulopiscium sp. AS2M-Bin001]